MAIIGDCPVEVYQYESELNALLAVYRELRPRRVLEIGSLYGGTLWHWLRDAEPGATVVSVDVIVPTGDDRHKGVMEARAEWPNWAARNDIDLHALHAHSDREETVELVRDLLGEIDFIFVDGGHDYATVSSDFLKYYPLLRPGGVIAFHDVACFDDNYDRIDVGRWWRDMQASGLYEMHEIIVDAEHGVWGIGYIRKPEAIPVKIPKRAVVAHV